MRSPVIPSLPLAFLADMPNHSTDRAHPPISLSYHTSSSSGIDASVQDGSEYGLSHAKHLDNKAPDIESIPLAGYAERDRDMSERRNSRRKRESVDRGGFLTWMEKTTGLELPFLWLLFNGIVSFFWGVALAVFAAGVVPLHFEISQFAKRHDADWTNEIVALLGSFATMHVTYVLQQTLELYSHIILAGEFTLADIKWMQGVNEVTLFAEFPARPGGPRQLENPRGFVDHLRIWWGAFYRWCDNRRLAWILVYFGMALHTTSVVSILQPGELYHTYGVV